MLGDRESSYGWERDGEPVFDVIQGIAGGQNSRLPGEKIAFAVLRGP